MSLMRAIEQGDYRLPTELNPDMDARVEAIALRAMARSPEARYPSMVALGADLLPLASADTQSAWSRYFSGDDSGARTPGKAPTPGARAARPARHDAAPSSQRGRSSPNPAKWPRSRIEAAVLGGVVVMGLLAIVALGATSREDVVEERTALDATESKAAPAMAVPAPAAAVLAAPAAPAPAIAAPEVSPPPTGAPEPAPAARARAGEVAGEPAARATSAGQKSRLVRAAKPPTTRAKPRAAARPTPSGGESTSAPREATASPQERAGASAESASVERERVISAPRNESLRTDNVDPWEVGPPSPVPPASAPIQ
jgi:hypothetical protein